MHVLQEYCEIREDAIIYRSYRERADGTNVRHVVLRNELNHREQPRIRDSNERPSRAITVLFSPLLESSSNRSFPDQPAAILSADSSIGRKNDRRKPTGLFPLRYATRRECLRAADIAIAECFSRSCISMGIRSRKREARRQVPAREGRREEEEEEEEEKE